MLRKIVLFCSITFGMIFSAQADEPIQWLAPYDLMINSQWYNQDFTLLQQKQAAKNRRWDASGMIQGGTSRARNADGSTDNATALTQMAVEVAGYFHPWVSGFLGIKYDNEFAPQRLSQIMKTPVLLDQAFITIGNLDKAPLYGTIGKRYVAFGQYIDFMITRPLTRPLGRIQAKQLSLSYEHSGDRGLYATAFTYNGYSTVRPQQQWGGTIGYQLAVHQLQTDMGVDYVSNLADSEGIVAAMGPTPALVKRVPAVAVHAQVIQGPVLFFIEYVGATTQFDASNISFNNVGAKPQAANTQVMYTFNTGSIPSNIVVGYTRTKDALALGMPEQRFATTYNILIVKNTILSFEYLRDRQYAVTNTAALQGTAQPSTGGYANTVTAQLAWFF